MARGRANKLRKAERVPNKGASTTSSPRTTTRLSASRLNIPSISRSGHSKDHAFECDHRNISPTRMKKVSSLLKELFLTEFDAAVPMVLHAVVENLQEALARAQLLTFIDHRFDLAVMKDMSTSPSLKEDLKREIKHSCELDFGEILVRGSTNDSFRDLCDINARHGHDPRSLIAPCACSFTHCMPCLEHLVEFQHAAGTLPCPGAIGYLEESEVTAMLETLAQGACVKSDLLDDGHARKTEITAAINKMREILWKAAAEIDPLSFASSKESRAFISSLSGVELYYTVALRELITTGLPPMESNAIPVDPIRPPAKHNAGMCFTIKAQYEKLKQDAAKLLSADTKGRGVADDMEIGFRKVLARHFRDLGNTAYALSNFVVANGLYTRAISYDSEDVIYPLNRAACRLKMKCFASAEEDCSSALKIDPINYKAWFRRGASKVGQGRYEQARKDFEEVLKLQKDNLAALKELKKLEGKTSRPLTKVKKPEEEASTLEPKTSTDHLGNEKGMSKRMSTPAPTSCTRQASKGCNSASTPTDSRAVLRRSAAANGIVNKPFGEAGKMAEKLESFVECCTKATQKVVKQGTAAKEAGKQPATTSGQGSEDPDKPTFSKSHKSVVTTPLQLTITGLTSDSHTSDSDPGTDYTEVYEYRAHAARVSRLLDGLQHCKENMDSSDAIKRQEALTSASLLVKEFEAQALLERGNALKAEASVENGDSPSGTRSSTSNKETPELSACQQPASDEHLSAAGASETLAQRKARLEAEVHDQLFLTWAFVLLVEQKTGTRILKASSSQSTRNGTMENGLTLLTKEARVNIANPCEEKEDSKQQEEEEDEHAVGDRTINGGESTRRGSDSGIERSPVMKSEGERSGKTVSMTTL